MLSEFLVRAQQWRDFATAHSCGLRHELGNVMFDGRELCHSAFVRVATSMVIYDLVERRLCHSAFVRVATTATA